MREILFRGKRMDNGEWVEGDLYQYGDMRVIGWRSDDGRITTYPVIPETVSEFTGLTDMNGKKIFEGDILDRFGKRDYVKYGEWNCGCCNDVYGWVTANYMRFSGDYSEVVGNIWDTPELLGGLTEEDTGDETD